ncbi:MAG: hypothetical protein ACTSW1_03940 [Candidatus Hodarchaeales archaeon]
MKKSNEIKGGEPIDQEEKVSKNKRKEKTKKKIMKKSGKKYGMITIKTETK